MLPREEFEEWKQDHPDDVTHYETWLELQLVDARYRKQDADNLCANLLAHIQTEYRKREADFFIAQKENLEDVAAAQLHVMNALNRILRASGWAEVTPKEPATEQEFIHGNAIVAEDDYQHVPIGDGPKTLCDLEITARVKGLVPATCPKCIEIYKENNT